MKLKMWSKEYHGAANVRVSIGTTGYVGGDSSETYLEISSLGGTVWEVEYGEDENNLGTLHIKINGDDELEKMQNVLQFVLNVIKDECEKKRHLEMAEKCAQHLKLLEEDEGSFISAE